MTSRSAPVRKKAKRFARPPPPSQHPFGHKWVEGKFVLAVSAAEGTVEAHALKHSIPQWKFDGARAMHKWPGSAEVSEDTFLAAIKAVESASLR